MGTDPGKTERDRYAELQRELQRKRTELKSALQSTSTLPFDTFQSSDPMLESALVDSAVQIFMRHLSAPNADLPDVDMDTLPQREHISAEELRECIATITSWEPAEPPDVQERLDEERMWILADLTLHGHGLTRQRATAELRRFLDRIWNDEIEIELLEDLIGALRKTNGGGGSALMHVLMRAASGSLERRQEHADA